MHAEEDFLMLSGIQHFAFCRRQWALIHIEQQWEENLRTVEGALMHERVHKASSEKRGDCIQVSGMQVFSRELGIRGICDMVELHRDDERGVSLFKRPGKYRPIPVEYKRGKPKEHDADALQLCAQALCLEEMLLCDIPEAYLYYGETRRRQEIVLDRALRESVRAICKEMHALRQKGYTPKVKSGKECKACSLANICLPALSKSASAAAYMRKALYEEEPSCENS